MLAVATGDALWSFILVKPALCPSHHPLTHSVILPPSPSSHRLPRPGWLWLVLFSAHHANVLSQSPSFSPSSSSFSSCAPQAHVALTQPRLCYRAPGSHPLTRHFPPACPPDSSNIMDSKRNSFASVHSPFLLYFLSGRKAWCTIHQAGNLGSPCCPPLLHTWPHRSPSPTSSLLSSPTPPLLLSLDLTVPCLDHSSYADGFYGSSLTPSNPSTPCLQKS